MFDFDFCNALAVRARVGSGTITAIYYYYYYYYYHYYYYYYYYYCFSRHTKYNLSANQKPTECNYNKLLERNKKTAETYGCNFQRFPKPVA